MTTGPRHTTADSLAELVELTRSSGIHVVDTIIQQRQQVDPRYLVGLGKLRALTIHALQVGAGLLIFDQDLTPSQIRSITD